MEVPMRRVRVRLRLSSVVIDRRGQLHITLPATPVDTLEPATAILPPVETLEPEAVVTYDRQQDKKTDYYLAKTEMAALMDGTSLPDEAQKLVLSFFRFDVEKRRGDPSRSSLLMSVEPREPPRAVAWDTPLLWAIEGATRQLHGAELPSVDVFDSMGEVEARGLQALMSCRQSYGSAPLAATVLRAASKSQKAFEEFKTLLGQVMKRATKKNTSRGYGRKKDEAMEQYWLRIGEIPVAIQDPRLRQLRKAIDSIRACSSVGRQGEGRPWVRDNRDWFVENDCPYAPPRMTPDADELDWIGRCYKDDYGVWCIKKVEFSQQDKELAVYAYPADEEPPEDDDELERELLEPFKEALDDGDNVWVESRAPVA
jgi:hypothetical protein